MALRASCVPQVQELVADVDAFRILAESHRRDELVLPHAPVATHVLQALLQRGIRGLPVVSPHVDRPDVAPGLGGIRNLHDGLRECVQGGVPLAKPHRNGSELEPDLWKQRLHAQGGCEGVARVLELPGV
eukprot:scaffold2945_cov244-Pinguiococcus_pyrenoidosus.AAC.4